MWESSRPAAEKVSYEEVVPHSKTPPETSEHSALCTSTQLEKTNPKNKAPPGVSDKKKTAENTEELKADAPEVHYTSTTSLPLSTRLKIENRAHQRTLRGTLYLKT